MNLCRMIVSLFCLSLLGAVVWAAGQVTPEGAAAGTTGPKVVKQSFCPPCEMKLDPNADQHVDVEGYRIYVCSSYCGEKVKKNPAVYIKKIQDAGETPESVPGKRASRTNPACGNCSAQGGCAPAGNSPATAKK